MEQNEPISGSDSQNNNEEPQVEPIPVEPISQEDFEKNYKSLYKIVLSEQELKEVMTQNKLDAENPQVVEAFKNAHLKDCLFGDALYALDKVLEGNIDGYHFFQTLCDFNDGHYLYMQEAEGANLPVKIPSYIALRLEKIEGISDLSRIAYNAYRTINKINDADDKMTFFDAGNMVEELEADCDILPNNSRAKVYFLLAKAYQKANASPYEPKKAAREEIDYLNKTLSFASDYKLIFAAQKRLDKGYLDEKIIVNAYKRALKETNDKKQLFRINNEIAKLYTDFAQVAGFVYPSGDKEKALGKAEFYYYQALRFAEKESQLGILKNIAAVQSALRKTDKWVETKTEIAMKHLKGLERCKALMKIAAKLPKQHAIPFYERAITEAKKANMPLEEKADIIKNSCIKLESLYQDPSKIAHLKDAVKKLQSGKNKTAVSYMSILNKYKNKKQNG